MPNSEYGWFLPSNTCPFCKAGAHNKYQHNKDCLINVPVSLMDAWRKGFRERMSGCLMRAIDTSTPEGSACRMGMRCAATVLNE